MTGQRPAQWFYFGPWAFSIDEAQALIADHPREPASLNVAAWANAYGLTHIDDPDPRTVSLIGPTRDSLDREYAMGTDLTKPVLVATLEADGELTPLFIDGVHRLYRAWREGVTHLPAYVLTVAETQQIKRNRIVGGGITPRRRTRQRHDR
ncbi:hypothetical protein [Allorhizocola rhizosphaerae]|uniref:hypothetical protein n=1 Tax=Allorhizocola rhizosphaerae TaxID=1872709 RepID=UPI000E3E3FFF|nr:hypothetical protein [Allorhizocola rhizosphaerae]